LLYTSSPYAKEKEIQLGGRKSAGTVGKLHGGGKEAKGLIKVDKEDWRIQVGTVHFTN